MFACDYFKEENLVCFIKDLEGQFTGWAEDGAVGEHPPADASELLIDKISAGASAAEEDGNDGEEEGGGLARSSLGAGHQITAGEDDSHTILLHGGGALVLGELDVFHEETVEACALKGIDGLGHFATGGLGGDGRVLVEINASVGGREDFGLKAEVPVGLLLVLASVHTLLKTTLARLHQGVVNGRTLLKASKKEREEKRKKKKKFLIN